MAAYNRPLPRIGPDNAPFWEAASRGALALPWCRDCARPHLPPGPVCPFCLSDRLEWRDASGRGRVSSWTRVHKAWFPAFAAVIPYDVVQVELEEGPRLTADLVDAAPGSPRVGLAVEVVFDRVTPEITLPRFRPAPAALAESPSAMLGECPVWDPEGQCLTWVDVSGRRMLRADASGRCTGSWALPKLPGSFALRAGGGMLMAWRNGLGLIDPAANRFDEVPAGAPGIGPDFAVERFNDGACDARGRFWTGTMARTLKDAVGHLFRIDPDLSVHRMADGIIISNGITWSPNQRRMYHCDSGARLVRVWAFDVSAGTIADVTVFADFSAHHGMPDGCTVDAEAHLWVALVEAGTVLRLAPSGDVVASITLPVSRPTSVAFGGADLRTLFVTSMCEGLSPEAMAAEPDAGRLFALRPGVAGLSEPRFAG
jgi:L-arabinonolactonase